MRKEDIYRDIYGNVAILGLVEATSTCFAIENGYPFFEVWLKI